MEKKLPKPLELQKLPKPNEKFLPKPTFSEKYSWLKPVIIAAIAVICIDIGIFSVLHSESNQTKSIPLKSDTLSQNTILNTSTTSWKTYTSQPGKFSLKYPTDYTLTENPQTLPNSIVINSSTLASINTSYKITIQYQSVAINQTLDQLIENNNQLCPAITPQNGISTLLNNTINGKLYKDVSCQQSFKTVLYVRNKNVLYIMTIDGEEKFDTIKLYVNSILSTMRFL